MVNFASIMDSPFKVELARFSHSHIIDALAPFVPGLVVLGCLISSSASVTNTFERLPIGYKTKVFVCIVSSYLVGLAASIIMEGINTWLTGWFLRRKNPAPPIWQNRYWQQVAAVYVGEPLAPTGKDFTYEELKDFLNTMAALSQPSAKTPQTGKRRGQNRRRCCNISSRWKRWNKLCKIYKTKQLTRHNLPSESRQS